MVNLIGYLLLILGTVLVQVKSEPRPSPFFIPKSESEVKPSYGPPAPSYGPPAPSYGPPEKPSYQPSSTGFKPPKFDFKLPALPSLPKLKIPDLPKLPTLKKPNFDFSLPPLPRLPKLKLPVFKKPDLSLPRLPKLKLPALPKLPDIGGLVRDKVKLKQNLLGSLPKLPKLKLPSIPKITLPQIKKPTYKERIQSRKMIYIFKTLFKQMILLKDFYILYIGLICYICSTYF